MTTRKTFNRIVRRIKRNGYLMDDEQVEFFREIGMYDDLLRIHNETINEFGVLGERHKISRLNRFIESVKEHEKEIFLL